MGNVGSSRTAGKDDGVELTSHPSSNLAVLTESSDWTDPAISVSKRPYQGGDGLDATHTVQCTASSSNKHQPSNSAAVVAANGSTDSSPGTLDVLKASAAQRRKSDTSSPAASETVQVPTRRPAETAAATQTTADGAQAADQSTSKGSEAKTSVPDAADDEDSRSSGGTFTLPPSQRLESGEQDVPATSLGDSAQPACEDVSCEDVSIPCAQTSLEAQYYASLMTAAFLNQPAAWQSMLPLDPDGSTLAMACGSGVLLCKLLCTCQPDAIDERVLNLPEGGAAELATPERLQNVTLCLNAASSLGASVSHIDAAKVADGQEEAVLECLWQIVRLHKLQDINLKSFPSLLALQQEDEQLPALLEVAPEALLLRWLNHHLRQPLSHWRRAPITSLDAGVQDGQAYLCLVQQLQPGSVDVAALLREADPAARASAILSAAQQLTGAAVLPPPAGLLGPNQRLHCLMLSELFHACPALQLSQAERIEQRQALSWLEEGDVDASREERTFRMWLNSLLPDAHVSSLYGETLRDGWILLQAIAHIRPGSVDFARVHRPPFPNPLHRRPKSLENCNLVVQLTKDLLHLPLINVGGLDILNGQRKIILAILYQLMRLHTHALLQRIRPADAQLADAQMDVEILSWANQTVAAMGNTHLQISSFADPSLSSGQFLITLLAAVIPGMVKPALVTPGVSAADKTLNAKYAISLARKLGCSIFLLWEDIVEVKPKMIAIFVASLMVHAARTPAAH